MKKLQKSARALLSYAYFTIFWLGHPSPDICIKCDGLNDFLASIRFFSIIEKKRRHISKLIN